METYPPNNWTFLPATPTAPTAFLSGVFGCDSSVFNPITSVCGSTTTGGADSIVINYFTTDAMGSAIGQRNGCTGFDVANDDVNSTRKLNVVVNGVATTYDKNLPPGKPLFIYYCSCKQSRNR